MTHFLTIKDNDYITIRNERNGSNILNNYPIHQFTFGVTDNLDTDFNNIINAWTQLYNNPSSNKFMIVFKTNIKGTVPVKYAYKMVAYIKSIKALRKEYGEKYDKLYQSVVIIENSNLRFLMDLVLKLTKPLAPIYIVSNDNEMKEVLQCARKGVICDNPKIKYIKP
tara:strand:+ start:15620 stop:16120 length:501 start_codon:yes stop_codon:yes gene_type:complete